MTFREACQNVLSHRASQHDYTYHYGIWREPWPGDIILGINDKKDAYANFPGVTVWIDEITSRVLVLSLTQTAQVNYIGWIPGVEDLVATDWETNIPPGPVQG